MKRFKIFAVVFLFICFPFVFCACSASDADKQNYGDGGQNSNENPDRTPNGSIDGGTGADITNGLPAGQYRAGEDFPVGVYVIVSDTVSNNNFMEVTLTPDAYTGQPGKYIGNSVFIYRQYVILNDGEYVKFNRGKLYGLDSAPEIITDADGAYRAGQYLAGVHIPSGEYTFIPDGTSVFFITARPMNDVDYIDQGVVTAPRTVTLSDGQYITVRSGKLIKAKQ